MAWPFAGDWEGKSLNDLPEIIASICTAMNERQQVYIDATGLGSVYEWAALGDITYPTVDDIDGLRVDEFNSLKHEIMDLLFLNYNSTTGYIGGGTDIITGGIPSVVGWLVDTSEILPFGNFWRLDDILEDIAILSGESGDWPAFDIITDLDWWLTIKEILNRCVYFSFSPDVTTTTSGSTRSNSESTTNLAWTGIGDNAGTSTILTPRYTMSAALIPVNYWIASKIDENNVEYDLTAMPGDIPVCQIQGVFSLLNHSATATGTVNGESVDSTASFLLDLPKTKAVHNFDVVIDVPASNPFPFATIGSASFGGTVYIIIDATPELADQAQE
jgi:hypothetical protein